MRLARDSAAGLAEQDLEVVRRGAALGKQYVDTG
jgi:hypothetical protein